MQTPVHTVAKHTCSCVLPVWYYKKTLKRQSVIHLLKVFILNYCEGLIQHYKQNLWSDWTTYNGGLEEAVVAELSSEPSKPVDTPWEEEGCFVGALSSATKKGKKSHFKAINLLYAMHIYFLAFFFLQKFEYNTCWFRVILLTVGFLLVHPLYLFWPPWQRSVRRVWQLVNNEH